MSYRKDKLKYIVALLIFISCGKQETPRGNFLDAETQQSEERKIVEDRIILDFEKEMEELDIFSFYNVVETDNNFVIPQNQNLVVSVLDKSSLALENTITIKKGRGPVRWNISWILMQLLILLQLLNEANPK